jgi:hypothetical protein
MFKWIKGRQNTGYEKLKLLEIGYNMRGIDLYILKYNVGDSIPYHIDPIPNRRHFRLNIEIIKGIGGELLVDEPIFRFWRVCLFRSDRTLHKVTEVLKGRRIVLSFGLAI